MKRPLILVALPCVAGLVAVRLGFVSVLLFLGILIFYPLKQTTYTKWVKILSLISFIIGFLLFAWEVVEDQNSAEQWSMQTNYQGQGYVREMSVYEWGTIYGLSPWWDQYGHKHKTIVQIKARKGGMIGDYIQYIGEKSSMTWYANEGGFDLPSYMFQHRIIGRMDGRIIVKQAKDRYALRRRLFCLREHHEGIIDDYLQSPESDLVKALVLGVNRVEETEMKAFGDAGLLHLLAISGMHVGLVVAMFMSLLKYIITSERLRATFIICGLILYCIYTGASVSTVRATDMIVIYMGHFLVVRKYDRHIALVLALTLVLLWSPSQLMSKGFQLSFAAVFGIFYVTPRLKAFIQLDYFSITETLFMMAGIYVATGPLIAYYSGVLPSYGFIANLLSVPVLAFIIGTVAVGIGITSLTSLSVAWLMSVGFWLSHYLIQVAFWVQSLPGSRLVVGRPSLIFMIGYYCLLLLWLMHRQQLIKIALINLLFLLSVQWYVHKNDLVITMLDVGNGDALCIENEGQCILVDGGGQLGVQGSNVGMDVLYPYLMVRGVRKIDGIIVSHSDFDHIYGIIELMDLIEVERLILSSVYEGYENTLLQELKSKASDKQVPIVYVQAGTTLKFNSLVFKCLYPFDPKVKKENNRHSNIFKLEKDEFSMLFTGDTTAEDEVMVLQEWAPILGDIDVLKVAHHGSITSSDTSFVSEVSPELSLISVGQNNPYGHPHPKVVEVIETYSNQVMTTASWGQIRLIYNDNQLSMTTYCKEQRNRWKH